MSKTYVEMTAGNFPYRLNERKLHVSMCGLLSITRREGFPIALPNLPIYQIFSKFGVVGRTFLESHSLTPPWSCLLWFRGLPSMMSMKISKFWTPNLLVTYMITQLIGTAVHFPTIPSPPPLRALTCSPWEANWRMNGGLTEKGHDREARRLDGGGRVSEEKLHHSENGCDILKLKGRLNDNEGSNTTMTSSSP